MIPVLLETANAYFSNRLYTDVWDNANDATRQKALAWAGALIYGAFAFSNGAYIRNGADVVWADNILFAVCEQAIYLLKRDPTQIPDALLNGVSEAEVGSVKAKFDKRFVAPGICETAKTLIGDLGVLISDTGRVVSRPYGI